MKPTPKAFARSWPYCEATSISLPEHPAVTYLYLVRPNWSNDYFAEHDFSPRPFCFTRFYQRSLFRSRHKKIFTGRFPWLALSSSSTMDRAARLVGQSANVIQVFRQGTYGPVLKGC